MTRARWALAVLLAGACTPPPPAEPRLVRELAVPAAPGSAEPNLAEGPGGHLYLTWIEPAGEKRHRLRFARRAPAGEWSAPGTVAEGQGWFVNWADFPALAATPEGTLFAHWLARSGPGTYSYDVQVSASRDQGATWEPPVVPHRDGTSTEHGFVSLVPAPEGGMAVIWLDGRKTAGHGHGPGHGAPGEMALMAATVHLDGRLGPEAVLDDRVCDCCQTAAVRTSAGLLVAYRDRSPEEVRDISVVRHDGSGWSPPLTVGGDGWRIEGCPVNGPALAARGERVALAWFSAPRDEPRVLAAFSADAGQSFGPPVRIDGGHPLGRVDVVMLDDGRAMVSWLEGARDGGDGAQLRVRTVRPGGPAGPPLTVSRSSGARASGFPRLERAGGEVVVAWRDLTEPARVRAAVVSP